MKELPELFNKNRAWANKITASDSEFFSRLTNQQAPDYLWIGCSDSRVPANEIVGLLPGELFVHRNIANIVAHTDFNCLSVVQYAVEVLKIKHIIVCGHYGCAGVKAAMNEPGDGLYNNWLMHIRDIRKFYAKELALLEDDQARVNKMCELNVMEQVLNLGNSTIVVNCWKRGQPLAIHGWIYDLNDGLLRDLDVCITGVDATRALESLRFAGELFCHYE